MNFKGVKQMKAIGFIGGSGLYDIPGMEVLEEISIKSPWGEASDKVILGKINEVEVAFLARHGRGHKITPTEVNSRANIYALKSLGVEEVLAFSAVGSLQEGIAPLDFVMPSQIIDRTRLRANTFFGEGIVGHVGFSEPFCSRLSVFAKEAVKNSGITLHENKTLVVMEGPAFSTKAESHLYRSWGADIINMSALPEAKLAREAGLCYQMICMSTDYDCWRESEEAVTVEMVIGNLKSNADNAKKVVLDVVSRLGQERSCGCVDAGKHSVITGPEHWPDATKEKLKFILGE
jgi:5'-methylthioadenosine phosphorylase